MTSSMPASFDVFTSVPTPERLALEIRSWGRDAGYRSMFGRLWRDQLNLSEQVIVEVAELPADGYLERAAQLLEPLVPTFDDSIGMIRDAGIERAVVHSPLPVDVPYTNDATARLVSRAPDLLIGFVRIDPTDPGAADEIRRGVTELGLRGVTLTPFWHGVRCSDAALAPIFEAIEELKVPIWIHTSMNWVRHRPLELEHPRHVDELAGRYPTIPILCGHGGWPWVQEMVAVAWRHPNVFIDISAFRLKHVFDPRSGWEVLAYYGARTIRNKIVYGSTWTLLGSSPTELMSEAWGVPWPEEAKKAWLHDNATRIIDLERM